MKMSHIMPAEADMLLPSFTLPERLLQQDLSLSACYQCRKCSSGCPLTFAMDYLPDRVIRLALLGQEEQLLGSRTIWVCSSCETCTTRCPNGIDIAGVMDWLKEEALRRGYTSQPGVARFHQTFLETVRLGGGRLSEPLLLGLYQLKSGETLKKIASGAIIDELRLGWQLARRGRLVPKLPRRLKGAGEIKEMFAKAKDRD
jgi:heterodisulfide reductase subunit C